MALAGRATAQGTARFAARQTSATAASYRMAAGCTLSSIGYGVSLGELTDEVDARYEETIVAAVTSGCNVLDAAGSYRAQRSELALGRAIGQLVRSGAAQRDELFIMSKAGYIPYHLAKPADSAAYIYDHFIRVGVADPDDFAGGIHCMAPDYLAQQINWSLRNMDLRGLDVFLLQNPETQLAFVDRTTFRRRLQLAFARLEEEVAAGRIGAYGVATWEGFRRAPMESGYMSLEVMLGLVRDVAGDTHHFKFVQAPVSPVALEALTLRNQPVKNGILPFLHAARDLDVIVIASAVLGQGKVIPRYSEALREAYAGFPSASQRALQFVRSLPHVTTALFGSLDSVHVRENLAVLSHPVDEAQALRLVHLRGR